MNRESAATVRTPFLGAGGGTIAYRSVGEGEPITLFKEDKHHALDKLKTVTKPILIFSEDQGSGGPLTALKASGQPIYENVSKR